MHHLTAVAPKEKHEDDDRNISPETGIFITHSPTKTWSKNSYNNMFHNNYTIILLTMCLVSLCLPQQCIATLAATTRLETRNLEAIKASPPVPYECRPVSIRNDCDIFEELRKCTVITGPLVISLVYFAPCNITDLVFENLREITDFLFISNVPRLYSIKNMFPNLTVIRGRHLFTNYALVINDCAELEKVEFKSLIAIQRGNVLIGRSRKVCFTEKVNWNRLTLSRGRNNIFVEENVDCPKSEIHCNGCKTEYCWSNDVCQKFDSDSVIAPMQDPIQECNQQCLGGCYNRTAQGCAVCKGYTDHGTCVKECPRDKYASSRYWRCYTREECVNKRKFYIYKDKCVDFCPAGYKVNNDTRECDLCRSIDNCLKVCDSESPYDNIINIPDISTAQRLRGCQILNGSVVLEIYEFFDQRELTENLQDIKEIWGNLKIIRSPYLTSLDFLQNLEKIHGFELEHNLYAVTIYNNKNLTELWNVKSGFEIVNGGMYIHANDKLCNRLIRQFRQSIKHDNSLDSIQRSDQEVFCSPAILNLYVKITNHRSILLYWLKDQTFSEVEIIYRSVSHKEQLEEKSEIDTDVCDRIKWNRELKFAHELEKNDKHYIYKLQNLEPHTRYAILVKTFNGDDDTKEARSEIKYATTQFDIPTAPEIFLKEKTSNKFYIEFSPGPVKSKGSPIVDFFVLEVYSLLDDKNVLDTRDYCDEPVLAFKENGDEDYDGCCSRLVKEKRDQNFLSQLKREFACSLDQIEYCKPVDTDLDEATKRNIVFTRRFEAWETKYTIRYLEDFHLYVIQMRACNHAGCSSYSMLSARTNYSLTADNIYFSFCKANETSEYKVSFSEPIYPNGYITSYAIHFRNHISSDNNLTAEHNVLMCVTRLEHERKKYVYVTNSNYTFNQAAIRVHSLGRHTFIEWKNISKCSDGMMSSNILHYFFYGSLIFALLLFLWVANKNYSVLGRLSSYFLPTHSGWRFVRPQGYMFEDRQTLVQGFELVHFTNAPEEETIELQEINEPE